MDTGANNKRKAKRRGQKEKTIRKRQQTKRIKKEQRKREEEKKEIKDEANTTIMLQGLPPQIGVTELRKFVEKCGILRRDEETGLEKVQICQDENGSFTGDAIATYYRKESVALALLILDGSEIMPGFPVHISEREQAKNERGKEEEQEKEAKKRGKKKKIDYESMLGWEDWETRRHVILFNMFDPKDALGDPSSFYEDLKKEVKEEVEKLGDVESLYPFERNPQGVIAIKFKGPAAAQKCIDVMDGRYFDRKQIKAIWYDGITDYSVPEDEEDENRRLDDFGRWLEEQSSSDDEDDSYATID